MYAALIGGNVFDKYLAISPSLWVNYGNIDEIADAWRGHWSAIPAKLYICAGSLETWNQVLEAVNRFTEHIQAGGTGQLVIEKQVFEGKDHETIMEMAIEKCAVWLYN